MNSTPGSTTVRRSVTRVELMSPAFAFTLDTADGLRAVAWENRLTGRTLDLGLGPEVGFDIGLPDQPLLTPELRVTGRPTVAGAPAGEAVFTLEAAAPAARITVTYRWTAAEPVLRRSVTIENCGTAVWDRLLNVRLGSYDIGAAVVGDKPAGGTYSIPAPRDFPSDGSPHVERGFPVCVADEFFLTLAHPAGVAEGCSGRVRLRQYPGVRLAAGATFACMETVLGVAAAGAAQAAFVAHLRGRMRRVLRGHDRPYAVFDNFGSWPSGDFMNRETYTLGSLEVLGESRKVAGCQFDLCNVHFWVDGKGTLKECDPERFPHGLELIRRKLDDLGMDLGLWIDGSMASWSIGGNPSPEVQACLNYDLRQPETLNQVQLKRKAFCRATEPIRSTYLEAFRHHIREHRARLLKFDNTSCICVNPEHDHLPGLYSTEAIVEGLVEFFRALDAECPDVLLMLYWGYKSPWWLLHADTLFDSGLDMEAASPSDQPAPYLRDSVTQKLDQGQRVAGFVPALGKDSLGVWLSSWWWNSQIGKERWQEGLVMDLCRGSLLAQVWADEGWLSPPEWSQLADFLALLKAHPACFGNPRFVLGSPQANDPYGYCCADGRRAFLAINNATWADQVVTLELGPAWGLPDDRLWDLYRWYPDPARLTGGPDAFGPRTAMALRPFQVVLLEAVPRSEAPSLARTFPREPVPTGFAEPSRTVAVTAEKESTAPTAWTVCGEVPATVAGGALVVAVGLHQADGQPFEAVNTGAFLTASATVAGSSVPVTPVLGARTYPCAWQAWRLTVPPGSVAALFELRITDTLDQTTDRHGAPCGDSVQRRFSAHFLPHSR